jgi:hypothetical protein
MAGGLVSTRPSSNAMAVAEALPPSLLWLPTISPHMVAWWLTRVGSVATLDGQARCDETGRSMLEGQLTLGGGDFFASSSCWYDLLLDSLLFALSFILLFFSVGIKEILILDAIGAKLVACCLTSYLLFLSLTVLFDVCCSNFLQFG